MSRDHEKDFRDVMGGAALLHTELAEERHTTMGHDVLQQTGEDHFALTLSEVAESAETTAGGVSRMNHVEEPLPKVTEEKTGWLILQMSIR